MTFLALPTKLFLHSIFLVNKNRSWEIFKLQNLKPLFPDLDSQLRKSSRRNECIHHWVQAPFTFKDRLRNRFNQSSTKPRHPTWWTRMMNCGLHSVYIIYSIWTWQVSIIFTTTRKPALQCQRLSRSPGNGEGYYFFTIYEKAPALLKKGVHARFYVNAASVILESIVFFSFRLIMDIFILCEWESISEIEMFASDGVASLKVVAAGDSATKVSSFECSILTALYRAGHVV